MDLVCDRLDCPKIFNQPVGNEETTTDRGFFTNMILLIYIFVLEILI